MVSFGKSRVGKGVASGRIRERIFVLDKISQAGLLDEIYSANHINIYRLLHG